MHRISNGSAGRIFLLVVLFHTLSATAGFIRLKNGYFWDAGKEEYFIPHGIAYQSWNPPVYANQTTNQVEYDLREMKRLHVNSLRVEFTWSQIETNAGCYTFENADFLIRLAEELDLKLYILMGYQYPPGWFKTNHPGLMAIHYNQYTGTTGMSDVLNYSSPEARAAYTSYVGTICARYKDSSCIGGWIVGNEFAFYDLWEPPDQYPNHRFLGFDTNYSLPAFQAFLTNRYGGNIAELNATWDTAHADFSAIAMPTVFPSDRRDPKTTQQSGYTDVLHWRARTIADFLSAGVGAARQADTNHLVTYAMVGGIFSGYDSNIGSEDARTIVSVCASNGTPIDFWTVNNYPWTWTGNEMRSMDYGLSKYRATIGLPVMVSECGLSDNDTIFAETVYRQKHALASLPWEAIMSGAIGAHIFHWNDRNEFFAYNNVLKREAGFGMMHANRRVKEVYGRILDAYRRMDELRIERLFPGAVDPPPDILAYWSPETDLGYNRYNQEFAMIWPAFKRMGFQIGIMNEDQFDAGYFTNSPVLFLPRNFLMEPQRLAALETNVLASGIHLFAEADLPGQYDSYYRSNTAWSAVMAGLFGLDVTHAFPGYESGNICSNYDDNHRVFVTVTNATGLLNASFSTKSWKIWHGLTNLDATVLATHTGESNTQSALPALTVKRHVSAWAAFSSIGIGDQISDGVDSSRWEHPWDVRTMLLDAVLRQTFNLQPAIELSGDPYASYVLPDYVVCSNGSVLISLLNMSGPDHPVTNLLVTAPALLNGKKVENLSRGGVIAQAADAAVSVAIAGDEFLLLYAYDTDATQDASLVRTNRGKIWFENGDGTAPTRIYPAPTWSSVQVGYSIPDDWDWENIRVALEKVGPESNACYGLSRSNWVAPGSGTRWIHLPVRHADVNNTNYVSTLDGGRYVMAAWLEDMGEIHSRTEIPVELFWGIRPLALPDPLQSNTDYAITLEWQDIPSYDPAEGDCPLNRADQWPLSDHEDDRQQYRVTLELLNTASNVLLSTNVVTSRGTGRYTFDLVTPPQTRTSDWWRATLVALPLTYDMIDSFEDRAPGNNKSWYTNDAPMNVWLWGNYSGVPAWWDQGIGIAPVTDGKQSDFLVLKTASSFTYSGHTYNYKFDHTNDYSSIAVRSNIWISFDLAIRDTNELGNGNCSVEIMPMDIYNGKRLLITAYTNNGAYQHFNRRMSDMTGAPPYPGSPIDWTKVNGFGINVNHARTATPYVFYIDNIRFTGTPVRAGSGGMTNAIYLSNGDLYGGPDPDREPILAVLFTNGNKAADNASAAVSNGTDFALRPMGTTWTNRFAFSQESGRMLTLSGAVTNGPGASSFTVHGLPASISAGGISNFWVEFNTLTGGRREASLVLLNDGSNYTLQLAGMAFNLSSSNGPAAGGGDLVITNLEFGGALVTNVMMGGLSAIVAEQGVDWVRLVLPAQSNLTVDITVQTDSAGSFVLPSAYRYNSAGSVGWDFYTPFGWTNMGFGINGQVRALLQSANGALIAGGAFSTAGCAFARCVASWNGTAWTNLGSGMNTSVFALAQGPDGRVYAAGAFTNAGGINASRIAVWDGSTWTNLGEGLNGSVNALAADTNGYVYAGGEFTQSGSLTSRYVACWDGESWTNLGSGLSAISYALALSSDGHLYVGGYLTNAGGVTVRHMACWDGTEWTTVGSNLNSDVRAIYIQSNGTMYAGGYFSSYAARWSGTVWSNLRTGLNGSSHALAAGTNDAAIFGGTFTTAGGSPASSVARWDGAFWTNMGVGFGSAVYALCAGSDGEMYAGGVFTNSGRCAVSRVARWESVFRTDVGVAPTNGPITGGIAVRINGFNLGNGADITNVTLCGIAATNILMQCATQVIVQIDAGPVGQGDAVVYSASHGMSCRSNVFAYFAPRIVVAGTNGVLMDSDAPVQADNGTWFDTVIVDAPRTHTFSIMNLDSNNLTIAGAATNGPDAAAFRVDHLPAEVAGYGTGVFNVVFAPIRGGTQDVAITMLNDSTNFVLHVRGVGRFDVHPLAGPSAGGHHVLITNYIFGADVTNVLVGGTAAVIEAQGTNWIRLTVAAHAPGTVDILAQSAGLGDRSLIQAYTYNPPGAIGWVSYGPHTWTNLGSGMSSTVNALLSDGQGRLYAGGSFISAGGTSAYYIAMWDGEKWSRLSNGMNTTVYALARDTNGYVYAGGSFTTAGGSNISRIARWDGTNWHAVGGGFNNTINAMVFASNGDLYVGGDFTNSGSVGVTRVARWNGEMWTNLGSGVNSTLNALTLDTNGALYAGGWFSSAGGISANYIARWNGEAWNNLGVGMNNNAYALVPDTSGQLFAGGMFTTAGGSNVNYMARWDGNRWSRLGTGLNSAVYSLLIDTGNVLYAGGAFSRTGSNELNYIGKWDGTSWSRLGNGLTGNYPSVYALAGDSNGVLYAGGSFTNSGTLGTRYIAKWGPSWRIPYTGVYPDSGPATGGVRVTLIGPHLGDGTDITNVIICGAAVAGVESQSLTQVVVRTAASVSGWGDIQIYSTSYGVTIKSNAWRAIPCYTVEVVSARGTTDPVAGPHVYLEGVVAVHQAHSPATEGATQFVCAGWSLLGHEPSSGISTDLVLTVTNHAVLTWLWTTNYYLTTAAQEHGGVTPPSGWQSNGIAVVLTAEGHPYYHFTRWSGDVPDGQTNANPMNAAMDRPRALTAVFAANVTTNTQTPEWWLARYDLTNDFEAAAAGDSDDDKIPTWQEFLGDTCPTDGVSYLRFGLVGTDRIGWFGGTAAIQYLEWNGAILSNAWIPILTNLPPTTASNNLPAGYPAFEGYYRIRTERP